MLDNQFATFACNTLIADTFGTKEVMYDARTAYEADADHCNIDVARDSDRSLSLGFGHKEAPQCTRTVGHFKKVVQMHDFGIRSRYTDKTVNCNLMMRAEQPRIVPKRRDSSSKSRLHMRVSL